MKFVPVPGTKIMMCIHETRRSDYAAFAAVAPDLNRQWERTFIHKIACGGGNDHPAVSIGYDEAVAFCAWLSQRDKRAVRLPTDREWSSAVGIAQDESWNSDATPVKRSGGVPNRFPWEGSFPPKVSEKDGNYWDLSAKEAFVGYESFARLVVPGDNNDRYPTTAPVMSFRPNKLGIYDLGGNAVEWVQEWFDDTQKLRTTRGGGWFSDKAVDMESSFRNGREPARLGAHVGFRCVVDAP